MENKEKAISRRKLNFRRHLLVFSGVNLSLYAINAILGGAWWFHFATLIWGAALIVHFMIVKALSVDEAWAEDRVFRLRIMSYDLGHILQISDSYNKKSEETSRVDKGPTAAC